MQFTSQIQKGLHQHKLGKPAEHFTSKEMVDNLPPVPKIPVQPHKGLIRIQNLERNQASFACYLHAMRAAAFEVAYEDLDGLYGVKWFHALLGFLGLIGETTQESEMVKVVGPQLCEDQINGLGDNDYENLAGLMSCVECYRLLLEGSNASSLAFFFPPQKDICLLAPRDVVCPSQCPKVSRKIIN